MAGRANGNRTGGGGKRRLRIAALAAAGLLLLLLLVLLYRIYIGKTLSWSEVYRFFGVETAAEPSSESSPQGGALGVELAFLSVGQGDCALVCGDGFAWLIDAGTFDSAPAIRAALDARGIKKLGGVIVTHPHTDHMGSLRELLQAYPTDAVYFADIPDDLIPTNSTYAQLLDEIEAQDIPLRVLIAGDSIQFPVGTVRVLWSGGGSDLNNCSLVLRLEVGSHAALFMGDAEDEVEKALLAGGAPLCADVLKVGHHGTKRATKKEFLAAVQPQYAVISCGAGNDYDYPKPAVLERLAAVDAVCLRTDTGGDIRLLLTERGVIYIDSAEDAA